MIEFLKYIFIGILQGITEVLPISSSAHLAFFSYLLNIDNSVSFRIFLHFASLLATLIFLRKKILLLLRGLFEYVFLKKADQKDNFYYCLKLILATIPIVLFSVIFKSFIDVINSTLFLIGILLFVNGLFIYLFSKNNLERKSSIDFSDALFIGVFQCFGVFSGISRSGSCINGTNFRNIKRDSVSDFIFFMFIPAAIGAFIFEFKNFNDINLNSHNTALYLLSFFFAFCFTLFSLKLLKSVILKSNFKIFSIYSIVLGSIIFLYGLGY